MDEAKPNGALGPEEHRAGIDHVPLAIPPGGEAAARAFFVDRLGFSEVPKPAALAARGGCWFQAGTVEIHVGVESDFVPARKAHPGLLARDPFGNRIELIDVDSVGVQAAKGGRE